MTRMLQLSLGLMMLALFAGTYNFAQMYRSGEIDQIYASHDDDIPAPPIQEASIALPVEQAAVVNDVVPHMQGQASETVKAVTEKINTKSVDPLDQELQPVEEGNATDRITETSHIKLTQPIKVKWVKHYKTLNMKSFSRAPMREEYVLQPDTLLSADGKEIVTSEEEE